MRLRMDVHFAVTHDGNKKESRHIPDDRDNHDSTFLA
jgi:hypothetical protein